MRLMKKLLLIVSAIVSVVAIVAGPAIASGRGGGGSVATISFAATDAGRVGAPARGDSVSFAVNPLRVKERDLGHLWVTTICRVNGVPILVQDGGVDYPSYRQGIAGSFTLDSPTWTGGSADCTAFVWMWPNAASALSGASIAFTVSG